MPRQRDSEVWEAATVIALGCATLLALAYLVALWKPLARSSKPKIAGGFFDRHVDDAPAAPAKPVAAAQAPYELPYVVKDKLPGASPRPAEAPAAAASPAAAPAVADAAPQSDGVVQATPKEAAAAGLPADAAGLGKAANQPNFLDRAARALVAHPGVLKYLLNSKTFNDALFSTKWSQKMCDDPAAVKAYLSDGSSSNGVSTQLGTINALLSNPDSARVAAQSEFGKRVLSCSTWDAIGKDPKAVGAIATANPAFLPLMMNPTALELIGSNPRAQQILLNVQDSMNAGPGH